MASGVQRFLSVTMGTGLLILGIAGAEAKAASVNFGGDTSVSGTPTWHRPIEGNPPASLDPAATNVPYAIQAFSVDTDGSYDFLSSSVNPAGWDNYTFLYQNSFNQSAPLTNVIVGNDNFPSQGQSGFSNVQLLASTQYFFITTGKTNSDTGGFTSTIAGPPGSNILTSSAPIPTPVPFEFSPGLGLAILGAWFGISQLRTRMGKHKSIQESLDRHHNVEAN